MSNHPFPLDELQELHAVCAAIQVCQEGGTWVLLLIGLKLPSGCDPSTMDAVLWPVARDGYPSRLFFERTVSVTADRQRSFNWNGHARICERNWLAFSWKISPGHLRLAQILGLHLKAFA